MNPEFHTETPMGKRMLQAVTPIDNDEYRLSLFNANGLIMQEVHDAANKLTLEVLINNATWSLPYWEELFRIKPSDNQSIKHRRRAVILKMNEFFPVTKKRMESIVETFTESGIVSIDDKRGDYIFEVLLKNSGAVNLIEMMNAVEVTKPAHLDYEIRQENSSPMFFSTALLSGDETTIYPWTPSEVRLETSVSLGAISYSHETLAVYPQLEEG